MSASTIPTARKILVPTVVYTMFVGGLFLSIFQFSLYYMAEEYGFGSTVMGLLNSVQFAFMILFTIPLGKLADKVGNKKVYLLQSVCTTVGCLLLWSRLGGMAGILIGVFLGGAGYGLLALLSTTVV
ncbi:MAG: MFS transporter, partial [Oscillospiraceae bacterium]|nr:MFS transporter [Oscillospiraceae bacterium]